MKTIAALGFLEIFAAPCAVNISNPFLFPPSIWKGDRGMELITRSTRQVGEEVEFGHLLMSEALP
jgi:hypothetical protein